MVRLRRTMAVQVRYKEVMPVGSESLSDLSHFAQGLEGGNFLLGIRNSLQFIFSNFLF